MPGLRARVQRDEHSGAWRPNSVGKEGKSPAVKERSLQTPQGCRTSHNSLPYPKVRSRGRAILERPGLLSSAPQVPLPTWTQLLGVSNATTPTFLRGAAHLDVGFVPRSHTPAPQSMVTLDARSPTLPGPPRAARSSPHFPKEVRSNTARPPAARALTGLRRKAGGGRRRQGRRRRQAGWRGWRPLCTARYCFQNTPARGIPQTADEAPPLARHTDGWPMASGTPSPGLGGCQGRSRMYEPSLGNTARGRAKFRPPAETQLERRRPRRFGS